MSEEEIEAIKELRMMKEINLSFTSYAWCNGNVRLSEGQKHTIDTILNLIEKQQKQIEKLNKIKSKVENKVNELRNRVKYVASSENFIYDEIADLLQELLEED